MDAREVERLFRVWQDRWHQMDDWVKRTRPTPTHTRNLVTELLPEQNAEELLSLSQLHQDAVVGYIKGLKELRSMAPERPVGTPVEKLTVSAREAAIMLGISRAAVYAAIHQKRIPTIRLGRRLLIPRAALDRLLLVECGE